MGRSRKIPFFSSNATVVATTAQGRSKKKCISRPKGKLWLSLRCLEAYYNFILVLAYPKRGDKAI